MKNAKKPDDLNKNLSKIFEELKSTKVSKKLSNFLGEYSNFQSAQEIQQKYAIVSNKFETLFDYVNLENCQKLISDCNSLFQNVEVFF